MCKVDVMILVAIALLVLKHYCKVIKKLRSQNIKKVVKMRSKEDIRELSQDGFFETYANPSMQQETSEYKLLFLNF